MKRQTKPISNGAQPERGLFDVACFGAGGHPKTLMETGPLIEAKQLSKSYQLWQRPSDRLWAGGLTAIAGLPLWPGRVRQAWTNRARRLGRRFAALENVSFDLERGQSLGIIGRNGSGKSTLLQILAGTLSPTEGTVVRRGRIAALLELGSGFNPEFTGRENVLLQAALAGVSRLQAMEQFDAVADFAAIGEFIDQPVKTYSSGMMVRLAFATQTILRPDVFIVDEALAVGDIFFQAKCARFFQERLAAGMSLLFVSHDLTSVKALCQKTLVLSAGKAIFLGDSPSAVSCFHQVNSAQASVQGQKISGGAQTALPAGAVHRNWNSPSEIGSGEVEIIHCRIRDLSGRENRSFLVGDRLVVECFVRAKVGADLLQFAIEVSDRHNRVVYGVSTIHLGLDYLSLAADEMVVWRTTFGPGLGAGDYLMDVAVGRGDRGDGAPQEHVHRVAQIASVSFRHATVRPAFLGTADLAATMQVISHAPPS